MHTFVLSRDVEEIPNFLDVWTKALILQDCVDVASILFRRSPDWEERLMYIPTIAMWQGHEAAFLEYFQVLADSFHKEAKSMNNMQNVHTAAHGYLAVVGDYKEELWGKDYEPDVTRIQFKITNPFVKASDAMIYSQWAELIRQYPQYAKDAPEIDDLAGAPFMFDWS